MSFAKGHKKIGGRKKGTPNKTTALLKDAIIEAAQRAGNKLQDKEGLTGYLTEQATENPVAFMSLLGKVLPLQLANEDGEGLKITVDAPWLKNRGV